MIIKQWENSVGVFRDGIRYLDITARLYEREGISWNLFIAPEEKVWAVTSITSPFALGIAFLDEITFPSLPIFVLGPEFKRLYSLIRTSPRDWKISVVVDTDRELLEISMTDTFTKVFETELIKAYEKEADDFIRLCEIGVRFIRNVSEYKFVSSFSGEMIKSAIERHSPKGDYDIFFIGYGNDLYIVIIDWDRVVGFSTVRNILETEYEEPTYLWGHKYKIIKELYPFVWYLTGKESPLVIYESYPIARAIVIAPIELNPKAIEAVKKEEVYEKMRERAKILEELWESAEWLIKNHEYYKKSTITEILAEMLTVIADVSMEEALSYAEEFLRTKYGPKMFRRRAEPVMESVLKKISLDDLSLYIDAFSGGLVSAYICDILYEGLSNAIGKLRLKVDEDFIYWLRDKLNEKLESIAVAEDPIKAVIDIRDFYLDIYEHTKGVMESWLEEYEEKKKPKPVEVKPPTPPKPPVRKPTYKEIVEGLIEEFERVKDRPVEEIFWIWMIAQALNEEFNEKAKELEEKYKRGEITADEYSREYRIIKEAENLKGRIIEEFGKRFRPMPVDYWRDLIEKNLPKILPPYRELVEKYKDKLLERLPIEARPEAVGVRAFREIEMRFGKSVADALAEAMDDIVRRMRDIQKQIMEYPEKLTVDDIYSMLISEFQRAVRDELVKRYVPPIIADEVAKFLVERTRDRWRELAEQLAGVKVEKKPKVVRPVERWEVAPPAVTVPPIPEEYEKFPVLVGNPMLWQMFIRELNAVADLLSALEAETAVIRVIERDELGRPIVAVLRDKWHKEFLDLPFIVYADWYAIGVATGAIPRSWAETTLISPYEQFKRYGETMKTRLIRYKVISEEEAEKPLVPEPERTKLLRYLREHGIKNPELLF